MIVLIILMACFHLSTQTTSDGFRHNEKQFQDLRGNELLKEEMVMAQYYSETDINRRHGYSGEEEVFEIDGRKRGVGVAVTLWPKDSNNKLHIPYVINSNIIKNRKKFKKLKKIIKKFNSHMKCNKNVWRKRKSNEKHYVEFVDGKGCSSLVGMGVDTYQQQIRLHDDCVLYNDGTVQHEMMHTMGFTHEHQRADRDQHVQIVSENIDPKMKSNFKKLESQRNLKSSYDYTSVLHYNALAFTTNGHPTIKIINDNNQFVILGQRKGLSPQDVAELNELYNCGKSIGPTLIDCSEEPWFCNMAYHMEHCKKPEWRDRCTLTCAGKCS